MTRRAQGELRAIRKQLGQVELDRDHGKTTGRSGRAQRGRAALVAGYWPLGNGPSILLCQGYGDWRSGAPYIDCIVPVRGGQAATANGPFRFFRRRLEGASSRVPPAPAQRREWCGLPPGSPPLQRGHRKRPAGFGSQRFAARCSTFPADRAGFAGRFPDGDQSMYLGRQPLSMLPPSSVETRADKAGCRAQP